MSAIKIAMKQNTPLHKAMSSLRISINHKTQTSVQAPDEVVTYHWNRIIIAGVLFLVLMIAAVMGVTRLLESQASGNLAIAATDATPSSASTPTDLNEVTEENTSNDPQPVEQEIESTAEAAITETESTEVDDEPSIALEQSTSAPTIEEQNAISEATKAAADETIIDTPIAESTVAKPEGEVSKTLESVAVDAPLFSDIDTKVYSEKIKSFVLANGVKKKLPVGSIDDIRLDHNNIATVYAHSEASGLKDEILHYVWILNGKKIAKVRSGVWANSWRSYSSKFINRQMKGDWKVELQNNKGDVLAASTFRY